MSNSNSASDTSSSDIATSSTGVAASTTTPSPNINSNTLFKVWREFLSGLHTANHSGSSKVERLVSLNRGSDSDYTIMSSSNNIDSDVNSGDNPTLRFQKDPDRYPINATIKEFSKWQSKEKLVTPIR
jgi:hypothetical protein